MADNLYHLKIEEDNVPIKIIIEGRNNTRVALGSSFVILRIPKSFWGNTSVQKHLEWAKGWLEELKKSKPHVFDKYKSRKQYLHGQEFNMGKHKFILAINEENRVSGVVRLESNQVLKLKIPSNQNYDKQELIKKLLIKFFQRFFYKDLIERITYYNQRYFKKQINNVVIKYNKTNWGSCSTGKNMNFSVRLFFAPPDVVDYVIVHEMAHLIEMNHSENFWNIVKEIIPDYKSKEKHLKEYSSKYDF